MQAGRAPCRLFRSIKGSFMHNVRWSLLFGMFIAFAQSALAAGSWTVTSAIRDGNLVAVVANTSQERLVIRTITALGPPQGQEPPNPLREVHPTAPVDPNQELAVPIAPMSMVRTWLGIAESDYPVVCAGDDCMPPSPNPGSMATSLALRFDFVGGGWAVTDLPLLFMRK